MSSFPWSLLGIEATGDARAIRSAYASRIKAMDLDRDVEGYAELRRARDLALRIAKGLDVAPPEPVEKADWESANEDESPPPPLAEPVDEDPVLSAPARWPHAAPTVADAPHADPALTTRIEAPDDAPLRRISPDFSVSGDGEPGAPLAPPATDPFAAPLLQGHEAASAVGPEALQSPFARLSAMLAPDGPAGLAPMDDAEEAQARGLLRAVLAVVHTCDLTRQDEMENWLAQLLADAWPRSAPLLDEAEAAFEWNREWGKVDARPSIEYLGARLRGYRFQRNVQQKGHRYHKAWVELSRPGPAGPFRFLRASGTDVRGLLAGVRKNFPELEGHLDARRVASWEGGSAWSTGTIIFVGLLVLGFLISLADPDTPTARQDAFEATVVEAFGTGYSPGWLANHQPELASTLARNVEITPGDGVDQQSAIDRGVAVVRGRVYLAGRQLEGQDFETAMRLRLALLKAARADGPQACQKMMLHASPPPATPVPAHVREEERRFAASLAERGLLKVPEKLEGGSASVPGDLARQVIDATQLSEQTVELAMQGKSSDADRCAVTVALLEATLAWQGANRRAILQML